MSLLSQLLGSPQHRNYMPQNNPLPAPRKKAAKTSRHCWAGAPGSWTQLFLASGFKREEPPPTTTSPAGKCWPSASSSSTP